MNSLEKLRKRQESEPLSECHESNFNKWLEKNFIENSSGIFNLITKVELKDGSIMKTNSDDYNDWYYQRRKEYIHTHIHS